MLKKELKRVRRLLTKVLNKNDLDSGHERQLRIVQRELNKIVASGKLDKTRVVRVVEILATLLLEIRNNEDASE